MAGFWLTVAWWLNLPIGYTRELGAEIVIAVDVGADGAKFMDRPKTALGVLTQTFVAVERIVSNQERDKADVLIAPRVGHIRWDQTRRAEELFENWLRGRLGID